MSRISDTDSDWGVVHHIRTEDAEEARVLRLRIHAVPESVGRKQIKTALEKAGRVFGEREYRWGNHSVLPHDEWLDQDQAAAEAITYTDLLDEAKGEKRVTVRFPIGLHMALVKAAQGKSFNQFCIDVMAVAVGYEQEPLAPAMPRLARMMGLSETDMAARLQKMAGETRQSVTSPFAQKFAPFLANITGLPPEQQKQMMAGVFGKPQALEEYQKAIQATADLSKEDLARTADEIGISVDEMRQRMETVRALPADYMENAMKQFQAASPEQIKDLNLMLRDVFSGNVPLTTPASEVPGTVSQS